MVVITSIQRNLHSNMARLPARRQLPARFLQLFNVQRHEFSAQGFDKTAFTLTNLLIQNTFFGNELHS
jgi:hypothetical protein